MAFAIVVLGAATLAEFALYAHLTLGSSDRAPWDAALPAHIVRTRHVWPRAASAAFLMLAALQTALLVFLNRQGRPNAGRFAVAATCCVAVVVSVAALRAPYVTSNDAYAYIGYAKLPASGSAYAPADSRLAKPFDVINAVWPGPLLPVYGPLDLAIYRAAVGPETTLGGAFLAARFVGLASLIALAALIFGLTRRLELVALVILNPGLYEQTVVNAHNDLIAVDLILAGMILGRTRPLIGSLVAATSGFVKINFAAFAAAFAARNSPFSRRSAYAAAIAFVAAGSFVLGGSAYWHALTHVAQQYGEPHRSLQSVAATATHLVLAGFAVLSIALAIAGAALPWSFAWSFAGLAVAVYPNYLVWGLPCALADVRGARAFLAILPIPSLTCDFIFPGSGELTFAVMSLAMVFELVRFARARRSAKR